MSFVQVRHSVEEYLVVCNEIVENRYTLRQAEKAFGIPRASIHHFIEERLELENPDLKDEVSKILEVHKLESQIRIGEESKVKAAVKRLKKEQEKIS